MADAFQTMKMVSKRTGLSPHVIRVWERRYGAVKPSRTASNRRVYRDEDVQRLQLLQQATMAGHTIGQAVRLTNDRLRQLLKDTPPAPAMPTGRKAGRPVNGEAAALDVASCLDAVRRMDPVSLNALFEQSTIRLGTQGFLTQVAAPLGQQVGQLWRAGEITAAHEHFLSASLRDFLRNHSAQFSVPAHAPTLLVGTPTGQIHELGAILVSAAASNLGWNVVYLGTSLPATDIAGTARQTKARAVALSIVYPEDDPTLPDELQRLRQYLPEGVEILVGGRGATAYANTLLSIGAHVITQLTDLFPALETLRKRRT